MRLRLVRLGALAVASLALVTAAGCTAGKPNPAPTSTLVNDLLTVACPSAQLKSLTQQGGPELSGVVTDTLVELRGMCNSEFKRYRTQNRANIDPVTSPRQRAGLTKEWCVRPRPNDNRKRLRTLCFPQANVDAVEETLKVSSGQLRSAQPFHVLVPEVGIRFDPDVNLKTFIPNEFVWKAGRQYAYLLNHVGSSGRVKTGSFQLLAVRTPPPIEDLKKVPHLGQLDFWLVDSAGYRLLYAGVVKGDAADDTAVTTATDGGSERARAISGVFADVISPAFEEWDRLIDAEINY